MAAVVELQLRIDAVEQRLGRALATLRQIAERETCGDWCADDLQDMASGELESNR